MKPSQLKKFRKERSLSQEEMANSIGISRITLRKYELMEESESVPLMIGFACTCLALGLKPFGMFGGE